MVELLERWLPSYGYTPDEVGRDRLVRYLDLLTAAQRRMRLVGSVELEVLVKRHVGESLALGKLRDLGTGRLVDIGSGAGFPGLVLAIAHPGLKTTLVESTQKKAGFLREVVERLGLGKGVEIWSERLEQRPARGRREPVEGAELVTVRALEEMEGVPGWLGRWMDAEAAAAFWVTRERVEQWRRRYSGWRWEGWTDLPGSESRGVVIGAHVPRGTPPG